VVKINPAKLPHGLQAVTFKLFFKKLNSTLRQAQSELILKLILDGKVIFYALWRIDGTSLQCHSLVAA